MDFNDINDILQPMTRLETALLTCMHMEALMWILDLSNLPYLVHLSLQDVYPDQLSIPPACRLDLHGEAQAIQQVCLSGPAQQPDPASWPRQSLWLHPETPLDLTTDRDYLQCYTSMRLMRASQLAPAPCT